MQPIGGKPKSPEPSFRHPGAGRDDEIDAAFVTRGLQARRTAARGVTSQRGELAEWSKASHSKCEVPATVPRVRIPHSPPFFFPSGLKTLAFRPASPDRSHIYYHIRFFLCGMRLGQNAYLIGSTERPASANPAPATKASMPRIARASAVQTKMPPHRS